MIKILMTFFVSSMFCSLHGQANFTAWAGDFSGPGGSACSSVGQVFYTKKSGPGGFATEGVQQPIEITSITSSDKLLELKIEVSVYPNPTAGNLVLSIEELKNEKLTCQLFDIEGRLILSKSINETRSLIDMNALMPSVYILKVINDSHSMKSFKIIKN